MSKHVCTIPGCGRPSKGSLGGLCEHHWDHPIPKFDAKRFVVEETEEMKVHTLRFTERVEQLIRMLRRHKERYVRAWIAATGIDPRDACIVTNIQPNGEVMVVKRRDEVLTCCKCHEPIVKDGFFL